MNDICIEAQLQAFDRAALKGFVRQALGSEMVEVEGWRTRFGLSLTK